MDVVQLYQDYNIEAYTEGHKHCGAGWVHTACPFCTGNPGLHLGATLNGKIFYCWRCGIHWPDESISKLLKIPRKDARKIIIDYSGYAPIEEPKIKIRTKAHKLPSNVSKLLPKHKQYLLNRGFNPDELEKEWNLMSTGPVSFLDDINYKHRILAPIYWEEEQVSFQTRSINDKHPVKYMACPEVREIIKHKHILYGKCKPSKLGICVEGITDVWRFGPIAFATLGISYTYQQVRLIASLYEIVPIIFDDEPQALKQALKLAGDLKFRGVNSFVIQVKGDPGSLTQKEADDIVNQLTFKY